MSRCCSSCCCSCCRGNGYLQTTNDAMGGRHQGLRQNDSHLGAQGHVPSMIEWYRVWYMNSQCLQYAVEIYTLVYNIIIYIHWHTWYTWYTCYNCVTVCQKSDYIQWCIIPCFDVTLPDSYYGHSYGRTWRDHTWPRCPHQSSVFRRPGRTLTHQRQLCLDARLHILSKIGCIMVHHGASWCIDGTKNGGPWWSVWFQMSDSPWILLPPSIYPRASANPVCQIGSQWQALELTRRSSRGWSWIS